MPNTVPHITINLQEISDRNSNARHIVTGCAAAMPTLGSMWQHLDDALNDAIALSAQITRLSAEVEHTRLDRADLIAAMRAALAAYSDGEADPMWYLQDALDAPETPATASRRRR